MAQIKYSDFIAQSESTSNNTSNNYSDKPRVGYFSLANDGDTAIVRIMHDDPDSFDLVTVHSDHVDGKFRKISCLRSSYSDPISVCPLCEKDAKHNAEDPQHKTFASNRIYIHMIQYEKDENGQIVGKPVIWDRPAKKFCAKLINLMQEYPNLSNYIVKVKRNGASGDTNTDYDMIIANQQVYPSNLYIKDDTLFEGYSVLGGAVLNKSYEDLAYFAQYGSFPEVDAPSTTGGWGSAPQASTNGFNGIPADVDEMIPFDSPQAQQIQTETVQAMNQYVTAQQVAPAPAPVPQQVRTAPMPNYPNNNFASNSAIPRPVRYN